MSNQKRCVMQRQKNNKRKMDHLCDEYNNVKEARRKILEKNKEDISDEDLLESVKKNNIQSTTSSQFLDEDFEFLIQKPQRSVQDQCPDSDFTEQLNKWMETPKNDAEGISDLQNWIVDNGVPHNQVDKQWTRLTIMQAWWVPSIPKCTTTLLDCRSELDIKPMEVSTGSTGEFVYFGLKKKLKNIIQENLHSSDLLELILFIDGLSPFKSSSTSIWPVLCKVYTKQDHYQPFTVDVFAGDGKPKDATSYLRDFVLEFNQVNSRLVIKDRTFRLKIKFIICDTPARSFVKHSCGHTAFAACERCKVVGQKVDKVTVFLDSDAESMTDASFRSYENVDHHKGVSVLTFLQPPIDMVKQFVLDPMHLLYLGVTKRILEFLLQSKSNHKVRISAVLKSELERRTRMINQDIPEEFPRKMRHVGHYGKYKAVEYKFFTLYAAPVVLKDLVSSQIYNHFMLLTSACRLMTYQDPVPHVERARSYFKKFVDEAVGIYGASFLSINVHNLVHLCDDVDTTGCNFNELSAFCFESHLGSISRALRSPTHLLAQYCQRDLEKESYGSRVSTSSTELTILMQKSGIIKKLKYREFFNYRRYKILFDTSIAFGSVGGIIKLDFTRMSSNNDSGSEEVEEVPALYNFTLVKFVHKGKKRKVEEIDIVPSTWLKFDYTRNRCTTKYVPKDSSPEDYQTLHDLVRMLADAPDSYTTYSIDIKGRAETYEEALQKLEKLQDQEHVFSLESEQSASEVQKQMEKSVKQQHFQREAEKLKTLMEKKMSDSEEDAPQPIAPKKKVQRVRTKIQSTKTSTRTFNGSAQNHDDVQNQQATPPRAPREPLKIGAASTSNAFESAALAQIIRLTNAIERMQDQQNTMSNFLLDKRVVNIVNNRVDFAFKYNYEIPFTSKERFNQFNQDLKQNKFLKNDTCFELTLQMDKNYVLSKSYVNMLKRFLSKDVASKYTAMRVSMNDKSKEQFRGNEFSKCMDIVVTGIRTEKGLSTEEKDMITALSDVLCNVKKWT
ncbi:hypothetical protein TSAR_011422 [Trichomalopsis sarcophagae]|uniref:DUF4806 domain-containing protein n=1 Tax=Trichomalopsis sarcophagae TaxID=543379 RepID=A0A232EDQ5_9HYME|nr:hypothetical protein TSAR_011422 [Trichomalopsis sarcophagae]